MSNFPSGNFPKVRLGLLRRRRLHQGPSAAARMGIEGQSAAACTDLESFCLGNCTLRKCCHLGKYPWEVAAWKNTFGKVPNILETTSTVPLGGVSSKYYHRQFCCKVLEPSILLDKIITLLLHPVTAYIEMLDLGCCWVDFKVSQRLGLDLL